LIDRSSGVKVGARTGSWWSRAKRPLHLIDDQPRDPGQSLDEDDAGIDGADLFSELSLEVRRDRSAEHDQVNFSRVEPCRHVGKVVGPFGLVAEVAEAGERVVEDELALADQQYALLGVVGCHVGSFPVCVWWVGSDSERSSGGGPGSTTAMSSGR
jgi:hypothetical protein